MMGTKEVNLRQVGGHAKVRWVGHVAIPPVPDDRPRDRAGYSRGARIRTGDLLLPKPKISAHQR